MINEEPLDNACHVWSRIIPLKYGCNQALKPPISFFHRTIGGRDVFGSASRVDQAMDVLPTVHSAVNGVEWYAQTLNDALQTQCAVLRFVM
ncbi:hypothetical protein TNCV_690531 [Trichonephila clavipes]|nr:hypothetical protein TNCV_690531 [Trichonephila clavipes]